MSFAKFDLKLLRTDDGQIDKNESCQNVISIKFTAFDIDISRCYEQKYKSNIGTIIGKTFHITFHTH